MAGDQPVEQMAQRRELLLDALSLVGLSLQLNPGRDVQRLDVEEILDPGGILDLAQEVPHGPQLGFTCGRAKKRDHARITMRGLCRESVSPRN
jgi:hypothetical protein